MKIERVRLAAMLAIIVLGAIALAIGFSGQWSPAEVTRVLVGCVAAVLFLADVRPPGASGSPPAAVKALAVALSSEAAADILGGLLA